MQMTGEDNRIVMRQVNAFSGVPAATDIIIKTNEN